MSTATAQPPLSTLLGATWQRRTFSTLDRVPEVMAALLHDMEAEGYSEQDCFAVRLAVEEALVNAIRHGHEGDPTKTVQLRYQVTPALVLADVTDQGPGFNPATVPDPTAPDRLEHPGGRGLLLMNAYMSWVSFNERGNRVFLGKRRTGS
jgi:serine/threonine-protein kinase RsbW